MGSTSGVSLLLAEDISRLEQAVGSEDLDKKVVWILIRKISHKLSIGYSLSPQEVSGIVQILEKLRTRLTPKDVAVACNALDLVEVLMNSNSADDKLRAVYKEYAFLCRG